MLNNKSRFIQCVMKHDYFKSELRNLHSIKLYIYIKIHALQPLQVNFET